MKPLHHPSAADVTVEGILYALMDPVRAQIFMNIQASNCPMACCQFQIVDQRTLPKSTLSEHFRILREAGLIRSVRQGVEMHNTSRASELQERFGPLISSVLKAFEKQVKRSKGKARARQVSSAK